MSGKALLQMERTWDFNFRGLVRAFRGPSRGAVTCPSPGDEAGERWPCGQTDQHRTAAEGKRAPRAVSAASSPGVGAAGAPQPREGALAPAGPTPGGPASLRHQAAGPARRLTSPRPSPFKGVSVTVPTSGDVAPSRPPCCARSCDLPHAQCLHCRLGLSDASGW